MILDREISVMGAIFICSDPFQIINSVIELVAVDVVYFGLVFGIWNKGLCDQTMHIFCGTFPIYFKSEKQIPRV